MILFFYGPNTYAARQQIAKLTAEYEKKTGSNLGLERIDGVRTKPEELRSALQASPFLSTSRLVIVEELGLNKAIAQNIDTYLGDVPETTVGVFYDPAVDQRTSYFKSLSTKARTVKFEPLNATQLQQWVAREVRAAGAEIELTAVNRLLDVAGEDQWRLSGEITKLAAHGSPVTVEAINELVEATHTETIFTLVEAMTMGRAAEALRLYRQLRADGMNEMYMLSMVIWQLRNLLLAKVAGRVSPPELARAVGMSPYVAGKMLAARNRFEEAQLRGAFVRAVDTDYQIKSGGGTADVLVEQLIYGIASGVVA